jgi:hypothetical protein
MQKGKMASLAQIANSLPDKRVEKVLSFFSNVLFPMKVGNYMEPGPEEAKCQ